MHIRGNKVAAAAVAGMNLGLLTDGVPTIGRVGEKSVRVTWQQAASSRSSKWR